MIYTYMIRHMIADIWLHVYESSIWPARIGIHTYDHIHMIVRIWWPIWLRTYDYVHMISYMTASIWLQTYDHIYMISCIWFCIWLHVYDCKHMIRHMLNIIWLQTYDHIYDYMHMITHIWSNIWLPAYEYMYMTCQVYDYIHMICMYMIVAIWSYDVNVYCLSYMCISHSYMNRHMIIYVRVYDVHIWVPNIIIWNTDGMNYE